MKFDKFLAVLFSKKVLIVVAVLLMMFCLTACTCTAEDVLCLLFCGCPTPETTCSCIESICTCTCDGIRSCIDCTYGRVCDCILEPLTKNSCTESYYGAN